MPNGSFLLFAFAITLTLAGAWVQWRAPWYRMDIEEAVKDGKLTSDQARWRMGIVRRGGMILTVVGAAVLLVTLA